MKVTDWKKQWRGAGVVAFVLVIVAFVFYGSRPKLNASAAELVSFFQGDRTRILIATVIFLFSFLDAVISGVLVRRYSKASAPAAVAIPAA